jgi:hypothetical protein
MPSIEQISCQLSELSVVNRRNAGWSAGYVGSDTMTIAMHQLADLCMNPLNHMVQFGAAPLLTTAKVL